MYVTFFIYFSHIVLILSLGYYVITCYQWYSYKSKRVIFHFSKPLWHVYFFIIPVCAYYLSGIYFWIYFYFGYLVSLYFWYKKQDKPLVFTARVKRFFLFLILATLFQDLICFISHKCNILGIFMPIVFSLLASFLFEKIIFIGFEKKARKKLESQKDLIVITITASFGKTSIKNFLFHILKDDFKCYKTPRSVNTLGGLIKDVNENLPLDTKIYISEAGAREKEDIAQIANFLKPQIAIVGEIGLQHIEYFKTLENIRNTKIKLLTSPNLLRSFIHKSANVIKDDKAFIYGDDIKDIETSLKGVSFTLLIDNKKERFFAPILGKFNATNLAVCIYVALYLGVDLKTIKDKIASLKSVEHRLNRIDAGGKIIIDDSFNGNFKGMSSSYELVSSYEGRKVLVTPGIVESTKEQNEKLASIINEIFDIVIITGSLNSTILAKNLKKPKILFLPQKSQMEDMLAKNTTKGDLILFSNDAPEFI